METKARIYKYDNLKFFLILAVVIGHTADFNSGWKEFTVLALVRTFVYGFHMPLFIFLSGLFYKDKNTSVKAVQFLSLGILMEAVIFLGDIIIGRPFKPDIINVGGVQWYMYALAIFYILMHLLRKIDEKLLLSVGVLAALLIGYTSTLGDFLALTRVIVFFPAFLLGTMTDREKLLQVTEKKWLKPVAALIVLGWGAAVWRFKSFFLDIAALFSGKNAYAKLPQDLEAQGIWLRLMLFAVALLVGFALLCLAPNGKIPLLSVFGARTLQVYFWHTPFVFALIKYGIADKLIHTTKGQLLYLSFAVPLTLLLSLKPFGFPANLILKHTKKPEA